LIEPDEAYRAAIAACIRLAGCNVHQVRSTATALPVLDRRRFDLVVWGVEDDWHGRRTEVISELRLRTDAPLVLVDAGTASAQLDLEAGADQWLTKPFVPGALVGSIRAALRKAAAPNISFGARLDIRGMRLDGEQRTLSFGERSTSLTRQEWELLVILVSHPNHYLGARDILRLGWRAGEHGTDQVRIYVRRLRAKLEPMELPCRLLSKHGQGYCLSFS
jgi:DNA-binding response OmpR family regulator